MGSSSSGTPGGSGGTPKTGANGQPSQPSSQGGSPTPGSPTGNQGKTEKAPPTGSSQTEKREGGLPTGTERAERIARKVLDGIENGSVRVQDLEGMGLSLERLKAFIQEVEKARALMASVRGRPDAPPTFADLLKLMDPTTGAMQGIEGGLSASGKTKGKGDLKDAVEGMKETVDLEYQQLLEEYYRSLADPAWKRTKR